MTNLEDYSRPRHHIKQVPYDHDSDSDIYWKVNDGFSNPQAMSKRTKEPNNDDVVLEKYAGTGVTVISLIAENLLCHPFLVLRRQCQVHYKSQKKHIVPFTLIPVICHLHQHQGVTTLWKGLGSTLLIRSMTLGVEDVISKVTPWPKEISWYSSLKQFLQHACLKCVSLAIITPFYSASLVETVQSDIASEKPGIIDVFREGGARLFTIGGRGRGGRMLPIWTLVLPTVTLGIARYLFALAVEGTVLRLMRLRKAKAAHLVGAYPKPRRDATEPTNMEMNAGLVALVASDVVFYPFELILHRLHLQGTRTIVDNLDTGRSVLPILTNYSGAVDCYESCLRNEGIAGFYKGFGALILQHLAHIAVIRITRFVINEVSGWLRSSGPTNPVQLQEQLISPDDLTQPPSTDVLSPRGQQSPREHQLQTPIISNMRIISDQTYLLP